MNDHREKLLGIGRRREEIPGRVVEYRLSVVDSAGVALEQTRRNTSYVEVPSVQEVSETAPPAQTVVADNNERLEDKRHAEEPETEAKTDNSSMVDKARAELDEVFEGLGYEALDEGEKAA